MISNRATIHFTHNVGIWVIACMPGQVIGNKPVVMRSDDPRAVNCPLCMKSNIYIDMMASMRAMQAGAKK
jgi:hypothetical protein